MPGPRNKRKNNTRKKQKHAVVAKMVSVAPLPPSPSPSRSPTPTPVPLPPVVASLIESKQKIDRPLSNSHTPLVLPPSPSPSPPSQLSPSHSHGRTATSQSHSQPSTTHPSSPLLQTFIHDPGTGPRVLSMPQFIKSPFAIRPTLEDPMCAEFAQEEVLEMLLGVLPEETALMLWYNKSRLRGRVCPTCGRLYRLGDVLPPHAILNACKDEEEGKWEVRQSERLTREQELSGLCSPLCFITASCSYPGHVIRNIWGRTAEEVDDATWDAMPSGTANGLELLVKMTRMQDLGLAQLYFSREDFGDEEEDQVESIPVQ